MVYAGVMKQDHTRERAIGDIASLRLRSSSPEHIDADAAAQIIDQAFSLWARAGGDPREDEFVHVMGRLALHAMAHRQVDAAHAIIQAGYLPCRDGWGVNINGVRLRSIGGLAHCLAFMDTETRLKNNLPTRAQVLSEAIARPDWWGHVLDIDALWHGVDALVATENSHWRELRSRRGVNNAALHGERVEFERALIDAGCPVVRPGSHHCLLAAAIPEFAAPMLDTRAGLEHVRRIVSWGGADEPMARASAWTAAIRRDVRQVLEDPAQPGPRVQLLDELGVDIHAPRRSHMHAGVALAALQKAYLPVVDRLVASGKGFDWLDDTDMGGILAKLNGGKAAVVQAVARVPMGWLAPLPESRVNAITVQVANCNVALLERSIAEGWPLGDAMGQRKTPLKTIVSRQPNPSQTIEAMRDTLRCLVRACTGRGIDMPVDDPLLRLAVGLRDLQSLETLWNLAHESGMAPNINGLVSACCRAQPGLQMVETHAAATLAIFEFLWARRQHDPEDETRAKWLRECMDARNRALFDRIEAMVDRVAGPAWPPAPMPGDMGRIEDIGHMIEVMARKGADGQPHGPWLGRLGSLTDAVMAVQSRQMLGARTPGASTTPKAVGRI